ncbi:hypothetical protein PY650_05920 [Rhizobium calliandrae]|uniref:Uncharacterized protein n=1 Tax=Rhizobium calliandrae TaxID=1312182 RepID=A0ABT7KAL1_9HYPH|nr:hypothetical protein [Rhizobium calliandrae]MDL2405197.1 hypothetical protein [Rhizobium calliandrae]
MLSSAAISLDRGYGQPGPSMPSYNDFLQRESAKRRQDISKRVEDVDADLQSQLSSVAISLKIATSRYAMYMGFEERERLFGELDFLLDPDGWYEEDKYPSLPSYINFLKWLIEARRSDWTSLGFDDGGNLLAAYKRGENLLTAAFMPDEFVHWTSKLADADGVELSTGKSPLVTFVRTAKMLLDR